MVFTVSLYCSLTICLLGVLCRAWPWFRIRIGPEARAFSSWQRLCAAARGFTFTLFSRGAFSLFKAGIFDIMLQTRILKDDVLRWFMHVCMFWGFVLLLLMHALDKYFTKALFPDYAPTLNPFLFLRNVFGAMVLLGAGIALYRRVRSKKAILFTNASDRYAIAILALIMISGFLLEGVKIISSSIFDRMVEEYSTMSDLEEVAQLKQYWARDFGVVFSDLSGPAGPEVLEKGRQLHNDYCASCHSRPRAAFISYPLAKLATPIASLLEKSRADVWLRYVHFLSCFIGLAYLPFSKMFHIFSSPISLMTHAAADRPSGDPANRVTRRALALDACTHCGTCSIHCSVNPVFQSLHNSNVLPSEKLISLRDMARGKRLGADTLQTLSEGSFMCTSCYRCTSVCPAGIDLQDLWLSSRMDLADKGFPEPHVWIRNANTAEWAARSQRQHVAVYRGEKVRSGDLNLSDRIESFSACVQCQTCTNVCPVVACSENPTEDLGLTPQQIMNLLRLGLKKLTLGSRMVWDCVTCYMCQEHCPEGIRVADVLYELRNLAYEEFSVFERSEKTGRDAEGSKTADESEESLS